jgi:hypothetical protein
LAVCLVFVTGCGAILGLEDGEPRDDADADVDGADTNPPDTSADDAAGDSAVDGKDSANADSSDAADASDSADAAKPPDGDAGCPTGTRLCGSLCEQATDPAYGCGDPSCAPCSIANGTAACSSGTCAVGTCDPNHKDCNSKGVDGCETDITTVQNCGGCNAPCPNGYSCQNKNCVSGCAFPLCGGVCYDFNDDPTHCGNCTTTCGVTPSMHATPACDAGACSYSCNPPYADCDGPAAGNGCETNLAGDPQHCGTCGTNCFVGAPAHTVPACSSFTCNYNTCAGTFVSCGGGPPCYCDTASYNCIGGNCVPKITDAGSDTNPPVDSSFPDTSVPLPDSSSGPG